MGRSAKTCMQLHHGDVCEMRLSCSELCFTPYLGFKILSQQGYTIIVPCIESTFRSKWSWGLMVLFMQVTQQMQIPLLYADAVIGTAGASISYIRRASGATVTIQETRGVPGEMTVEISGTASQVQAAQQLIQAILLSLF